MDERPCSDVLEYIPSQIWADQPVLIDVTAAVIECECCGVCLCEIEVYSWCYDQVDAVEECFHGGSGLAWYSMDQFD